MQALRTIRQAPRHLATIARLLGRGRFDVVLRRLNDATPGLQFSRQLAYIRLSGWLEHLPWPGRHPVVGSEAPRRLGILAADPGPDLEDASSLEFEALGSAGIEVVCFDKSFDLARSQPGRKGSGPRAMHSRLRTGPFLASPLWRRPGTCLRMVSFIVGRRHGHYKSLSGDMQLIGRALKLAKALLRERIEHLHVLGAGSSALVAAVASGLVKIAYSIQPGLDDLEVRYPPFALEDKFENAAFVATSSNHCRGYFAELVENTSPVCFRTIRPGIDFGEFKRPTCCRPARELRLLSVCAPAECGGLKTLLKACRRLADEGHSVRCSLVIQPAAGFDRRSVALRRLILSLDLREIVSLREGLSSLQLRQSFEEADVFVLSCESGVFGPADPSPRFLIAAMAMELPLVASSVGGIPEILSDGVEALLVAAGDGSELAQAIARLERDSELMTNMGRRGRQRAKRCFAMDRWVSEMVLALCPGSSSDAS